jgi:hypothetical protein
VQQLMNRSDMEIRMAISECLDKCYQSGSPVAKLAECVENLRNHGWERADTRRVEISVLRMLSGVSKEIERPVN